MKRDFVNFDYLGPICDCGVRGREKQAFSLYCPLVAIEGKDLFYLFGHFAKIPGLNAPGLISYALRSTLLTN